MAELGRHKLGGGLEIVIVNSDPSGVITSSAGSEAWHTDGRRWEANGGTSYTQTTISSFGLDSQSSVSSGRSTTTSITWQVKNSLVTPALTGVYRVAANAKLDCSSVSRSMAARLYNATDAAQVGGVLMMHPSDTVDEIVYSVVAEVTFTGAAKTFELQYRVADVGPVATVGIENARIELWRWS